MFLRRFAVVALCVVCCAAIERAKAQAPITSLPRPAGDTDPAPQPQPSSTSQEQQQAPQQYAPESANPDSVHPITSLPKPPGGDTNAIPSYVPPTPGPVIVPEVTTTPAPLVAPASVTQPEASPTPATNTAPVVAYPAPTITTTTPHDAIVAPPQTVTTPEQPLHANFGPATAEAHPPVVTPPVVRDESHVHPFSTFGIQFKVGFAGIGFDMATPLTQHFNLRAGGSIFTYNGSYDDSGNHITANAQFRSGSAYIEYFPWSHFGFHVDVGAVFDANYMTGTTLVKPGSEFDLGDGTYYSSTSDPVHGNVHFDFGKTVAPSFTLGFGNIVPRSNKHFSFPFEIGFMYTGRAPTLQMTLLGTVCDNATPQNCQKIDTDPDAQANLKKELDDINSDIRFLRLFPIISQGFAIKF